MPYLTQQQLDSTVDLPVSLPIADLYPEEWLVISTAQISDPQTLTLRWLQAFVLSADDPAVISSTDGNVSVKADSSGNCVFPPQAPELVTQGLGLAFVGLYRNFDALRSPAFQAAQEAPLIVGGVTSIAPITAVRGLNPVTYSAAGAYSFVVCNNTLNRLLRVVVNGQLRASLGFAP